jgi:hypothetical protein
VLVQQRKPRVGIGDGGTTSYEVVYSSVKDVAHLTQDISDRVLTHLEFAIQWYELPLEDTVNVTGLLIYPLLDV